MMKNFDENNFTKNNAIIFEETLLTLCLFCIGAQRREFVVNITLSVSNLSIIIIYNSRMLFLTITIILFYLLEKKFKEFVLNKFHYHFGLVNYFFILKILFENI